jgi:hypothetical protein
MREVDRLDQATEAIAVEHRSRDSLEVNEKLIRQMKENEL